MEELLVVNGIAGEYLSWDGQLLAKDEVGWRCTQVGFQSCAN